jgi:hypothetical protein
VDEGVIEVVVARDLEARAALRLGLRAIPSFVLLAGQGKAATKIIHSLQDLPKEIIGR